MTRKASRQCPVSGGQCSVLSQRKTRARRSWRTPDDAGDCDVPKEQEVGCSVDGSATGRNSNPLSPVVSQPSGCGFKPRPRHGSQIRFDLPEVYAVTEHHCRISAPREDPVKPPLMPSGYWAARDLQNLCFRAEKAQALHCGSRPSPVRKSSGRTGDAIRCLISPRARTDSRTGGEI